jgi:integrase
MDEFIEWYCSEPRLSFSRTVVVRCRMHLESRKLAPGTVNLRLGAVRRVFRRVNRAGRVWGESMTEKVVWHVVREFAAKAAIEKLAPHDLRRTCARLCHLAGGELEQIQFLLGHVSIQTTERYLGCKQRIRSAVNDRIGIEPKGE